MKRLIVVRHGNTFEAAEPARRVGARPDLALTSEGIRQAARVAAWLNRKGIAIDRAVSGPLLRVRASAAIIVAALDAPCRHDVAAWLDEVDYGPDEGQPETAVIARIGAAALADWDRFGRPAPGWPIDPRRLEQQALRGVTELAIGTTLLVTSNGTARFLPIALGSAGTMPSLKLRTGALGEIRITADGAAIACWDVRPDDPPPASPGQPASRVTRQR